MNLQNISASVGNRLSVDLSESTKTEIGHVLAILQEDLRYANKVRDLSKKGRGANGCFIDRHIAAVRYSESVECIDAVNDGINALTGELKRRSRAYWAKVNSRPLRQPLFNAQTMRYARAILRHSEAGVPLLVGGMGRTQGKVDSARA